MCESCLAHQEWNNAVEDFCDELDEIVEETCPCGCDDDPAFCVYASTCKTCHKKYFGYGYGDKEHECESCRKLKSEIAQ